MGSIHAVADKDVREPETTAHADHGRYSFLPKEWTRCRDRGEGAVAGPDGTVYASVALAQEAFLASQSMQKYVEKEDLSRMVNFLHSTDEMQDTLEVDGCIVTTNQLDDYLNRGDHPLLAPMTLYVYSMWVHRVEAHSTEQVPNRVVLKFDPSYKLAVGYRQQLAVLERVPKIDGYTMPPPRAGTVGAIADLELNAMFKSVLHRPAALSGSGEEDPLAPYKDYHARPLVEDPSRPWSAETAIGAKHRKVACEGEAGNQRSRRRHVRRM